jgi:cytochrome c
METFVQETSSCIGCHATARTVSQAAFVSSDFSFTLNNAMPTPKDTTNIPWTGKPVSEWDKANWDAISRGYDITTRTYELLPGNVKAKLHCQSCHLDAGTDFTAACWVNMPPMPVEIPSKLTPAYHIPGTDGLQARINNCFEHSMNGTALCVPGPYPPVPGAKAQAGTCNDNKDMGALIAYMQWITEQWILANPTSTDPPRKYPAFGPLTGDSKRGQAIFAEQCAVCHGADGQGRYEGGVYFRPALWGDASFNQCAGMADPGKSALFIRANMPLDAGGLLAEQAAWDVATFIDCQSRPSGPSGEPTCKSLCPSR